MANTSDIMAYLLANDPVSPMLSEDRLTKMVYLSDWVHAIRNGRQITPINWEFPQDGPSSPTVGDIARRTRNRFIVSRVSHLPVIRLAKPYIEKWRSWSKMSPTERSAANHVIKEASDLDWDEFFAVVRSTFPAMHPPATDRSDLVAQAQEYEGYIELHKEEFAGCSE